MLCPNCRAACLDEDTWCRQCGTDLTVPSTSLVRVQTNLPAVLQNPQLPRLAAGVGALALGFGLELLRRNLLARAAKASQSATDMLPILGGLQNVLKPQSDKAVKLPKGYEIQETVVYIRRVIRRQG